MIITHSIHIQLFYSYSSLHSIHHIQSSHNQSLHLIIHSRDSNQFLSFHITINQISILILSSFIPQFGSPITPFHISPFHSFHSTFTFIHISLFYYILLSSLHSYSILLNTITGISFSSFISYFHLYLHSHIISILFISHHQSTSLCYHFINSYLLTSIASGSYILIMISKIELTELRNTLHE